MIKRLSILSLIFMLSLLLAACSDSNGESGSNDTDEDVEVSEEVDENNADEDAEVSEEVDENNEADSHTEGYDMEGFDMDFDEPKDVNKDEEITLETSVMLDEEALEDVRVRYQIFLENDEDNTAWLDAEEDPAGEYSAVYAFPKEGKYNISIHVDGDEDDELHEHDEYEITVD